MRSLVAALSIGLLGVGCAADTNWTDLDSVDELRDVFNEDRGRVRLVLILSPT